MKGIKRNFTGGEISSALLSRDDLTRYNASCIRLENIIPQLHGGARFRPGFSFIDAALDDGVLIPFEFNTDEEDIYVLVFTPEKLRIIQGDGYVLDDGIPVELDTPYLSGDLSGIALGFAQTGDIVYLAHPNHVPMKLVRSSHTEWSITPVLTEAGIDPPFWGDVTWKGRSGGSYIQRYKVTALSSEGRESLPTDEIKDIDCYPSSDWESGDYIRVFWDWDDPSKIPYGFNIYKEYAGRYGLVGFYETKDRISIRNSTFRWELSSSGTNEYYLTKAGGDPELILLEPAFEILDSSLIDVYDNGAILRHGTLGSLMAGRSGFGDNDTLGFSTIYVHLSDDVDPDTRGVGEIDFYYRRALFVDDNYTPDTMYAPPVEYNPFENGNNPGVAATHQQRLWFAGSDQNPATIYASQIADFENFNRHQIPRDDDSLEFTIASGKISQIKWMVPFSDLLIGTAGAENRVTGGDSSAITPTNVDCKPQSFWGSSPIRPIVVGNSIIHVQRQSGKIRDLFYSLEKDGYAGNDLSILSNHLFEGHTIRSWAYQQEPDSIVWAVRDDGVLLAMSYLKEQDIWGWSKHTTDGLFRWVCTVGGLKEDRLYAMIERVIDGETVFYIECLSSKWKGSDGIDRAFYVDSGLTYDGWNKDESRMLMLNAESWGYGEIATITATGHAPFTSESIGKRYVIKAGSSSVMVHVAGFASSTQVSATQLADIPLSLRGTPTSDWALMSVALSGLPHLKGKDVAVLADGKPVDVGFVQEDSVSLPFHAAVVHVGLPYVGIMTTFPFDFESNQGSTQGHARSFGQITFRLIESVGGRVSVGDANDDEDSLVFDDLIYEPDLYGEAIAPFTGVKTISAPGGAGDELTLFIKQDLPLPFHVTAIIADVDFGG